MPGRRRPKSSRQPGDATAEELYADIRAKCLDCCCGSRKLVLACTDTACRLHRHRCAEAKAQPTMIGDAALAGQIDIFSIGGIQ